MSRSFKRRRKLPTAAVTLDVTSLSHEGRGVGHIAGKVAFVAGALAGETVTAVYTGRRSQFDELRTVSVAKAAPARVDPPCPYADSCGGCSLQHMEASEQLVFKESVLLDQLRTIGGIDCDNIELLPRIQAANLHYRRKARLAVRHVAKKGGVLVGFREKSGSFITDMDSCPVLVSEAAELIVPLKRLLNSLQALKSIPQIEVAVGESNDAGGGLHVALVIRHLSPLSLTDQHRLMDFAQTNELDLYLQPAGIDSVHKLYPEQGEDRLRYFLPDVEVELEFHPNDFTQVNADINRLIVARVLDILQPTGEDLLLDLFCGLGNFTIPIAKSCQHIVGVEGSETMVQRAQHNADRNGVGNADFYCADLTAGIDNQTWSERRYNKILLDPPRSGALELMPWISKSRAQQIAYVSCNPATLARDAAYLSESGYRLKSAGVMDMFPHTAHVESLAVFESIAN